jgi:glycosyltransferase involved in cell wall biosynthesis
MRPSVDIVIDNCNYGRYLAAAVDSALAQTGVGDVIVVDDGSTDESREILRGYGDRATVVLKENGGQASALNVGWRRCRADAIIFLDSDDVLLPHAVERVAAAFERAPGAAKVQYRMRVIDADGRATGEIMPANHVPLPSGDLRQSELTYPFDLPWMAASGNAYAARALRRIMPIPEQEFATSADWYLRHLVTLLGDVVSLDDVCAAYRVHGGNSYARALPSLDLSHVRATVQYAAATRRHLERLAREIGLVPRHRTILSVSDLANRLISRKLEPEAHPLPDDRVLGLVLAGAAASLRRSDSRWPKRLLFLAWFAAAAPAPRRGCELLATAFLFPERRRWLNGLLASLTRPPGRTSDA